MEEIELLLIVSSPQTHDVGKNDTSLHFLNCKTKLSSNIYKYFIAFNKKLTPIDVRISIERVQKPFNQLNSCIFDT